MLTSFPIPRSDLGGDVRKASHWQQAEATKEVQRAGIAHAKAKGEASPYRGRAPSFDRAQLDAVQDMLGQGSGVTAVAKATGLSRQAVYRIQADPAAAEATVAMWGGLGIHQR